MDDGAFDRMTRLLVMPGSRRAAVKALFAASLLGSAPAVAAKRQRRGRGTGRIKAQAGLRACLAPGPGQNLSRCDFTGRDLRGANLRGANLSRARFAFANLCGADLRGSNLGKTDFTGAHLFRANLRGTNLATAELEGATFCQTRRPDGRLDHAHCPPGGGAACCGDGECPSGRHCNLGHCLEATCLSPGQVCVPLIGTPCCPGAECQPTAAPTLFKCQSGCETDEECQQRFNSKAFICGIDLVTCPLHLGKCCINRPCSLDVQCPEIGNTCCPPRLGVCCAPWQECSVLFCSDQ